jgi:predicted DNA-binding transcriptional regulator YafY
MSHLKELDHETGTDAVNNYTYLLSHHKAKAQELAEKFEVSVRTIYRDIDAISRAGIPITTFQGCEWGNRHH